MSDISNHIPPAPECDRRAHPTPGVSAVIMGDRYDRSAYVHGSAERQPDPEPVSVDITYRTAAHTELVARVDTETRDGWDPDEHDHLGVAVSDLAEALSGTAPDLRDGFRLTVVVHPPADGSPAEKAACVSEAVAVIRNYFPEPKQPATYGASVDCPDCGATYVVPWGKSTDCPRCRTRAAVAAEWEEQVRGMGY